MAEKPTVGYIGMGIMGSAMAGRLIDAGYAVTVWNRSKEKCEPLEKKGAKVADSAQDLVETCDVVFSCTSDPASARAVVFGEKGVLAGIAKGKRYIDMSTVDEDCVIEIAEAITASGGRFLEAPVSGSKGPALNGQLVILSAGEEALQKEVQPMLDILGKRTFFLGEARGCFASQQGLRRYQVLPRVPDDAMWEWVKCYDILVYGGPRCSEHVINHRQKTLWLLLCVELSDFSAMSLQEENEDLRQELERLKAELARMEELQMDRADSSASLPAEGSKKHRVLRNAQTQQLEELMVENNHIAEQLQSLEDENANLKRQVELQKEELKAMEATDKTKVIEEEPGKKKSKLHLLKDKVNIMQKQMKEDNALGEMLSKKRKVSKSLEKQLEDANARWKRGQQEWEQMHTDLLESEAQNRRQEEAYQELYQELEELRAMKEAEGQARDSHAEHLNEQLMMLLTPTPVNDQNEGNFNFGPGRASVEGGKDLLSQLSQLPDSDSDESSHDQKDKAPFLDAVPPTPAPPSSAVSAAPETAGDAMERLAELQGECHRLKEEVQQCKQRASTDARREIALREERETLQKEVLKLQEEQDKANAANTAKCQRLQQEMQLLEEERAKALANSERLQAEMQALQEEFARLSAVHGSGLDAVEQQLEEERRLREECARAIRSECAAAAEILKQTEVANAEIAVQEADRQTDVSNTEVLSCNASPPPAVALAGAAPLSAPLEMGSAQIQLAPWKSETSMNSKVVELEEELERHLVDLGIWVDLT
eukprot:s3609_g7.t1